MDPVSFPKNLFAATVERENVSAGVVVAVATLVVNNGDSVPAEKVVTVPPLPVMTWHPNELPLNDRAWVASPQVFTERETASPDRTKGAVNVRLDPVLKVTHRPPLQNENVPVF